MVTCNVPPHQHQKAVIGTLLTTRPKQFLMSQIEDKYAVPTTLPTTMDVMYGHTTAYGFARRTDIIFMLAVDTSTAQTAWSLPLWS